VSAWIWILILLDFGFLAFDQPDLVARAPVVDRVAVANEEWRSVTLGNVEGVIVAAEDVPLFANSLGLDLDEDAYWRPPRTQVESAEAALADEAGELDHLRQYAGFREGGDRQILINGFRDTHGIEWRERPVLVNDGGGTLFHRHLQRRP